MTEKKYVIAMDQGTTSSRAIVFDRTGAAVSVAQHEFPQIYPQPGWVEHDPADIWSTQMGVTMEAMQKIDARPDEIAAIGIANQRETTIVWDAATGRPVYNAIVWQCRRTADIIDKLNAAPLAAKIHERTGLIPDAYFSASKIAWILDNVEGAREKAERGELRFGTVDSWLIWNLTDGRVHATDYTNASRTMLFDIRKLCWDDEILGYFGIPKSMLPEVRPSSGFFGETTRFGGSIAISGAAGDQQSALFGQCCFDAGEVKTTYGTGGFMLLNTGSSPVISDQGLLTTVAASADGKVRYALEGSIFIAGAAVQWLRDELKMLGTAPESEKSCLAVPDANGMYIVPAFSGLAAPYWNQRARGTIVGLTRGVSRDHFIRATVESMAYQTNDLLAAMRAEAGLDISELKVDGGASANDFLMGFQADISDVKIVRPESIETTASGAAFLAGLASGFWRDADAIREGWKRGAVFEPKMSAEKRVELLRGWKKAVRAAISWSEE